MLRLWMARAYRPKLAIVSPYHANRERDQSAVGRLPRAGHYVAQCLNVDVSSFGDTEVEALDNLREALELYFEDMPSGDVRPIEGVELRTLTLQSA